MKVMQGELDAWALAQVEVDKLPPYLADDELTVDRLVERNGSLMTITDAARILKQLVKDGKLERVKRRNPKGGSRMWAYRTKQAARHRE